MSWHHYKKEKLKRLENAIKDKETDEGIHNLLFKINSNESLVTLSSCYGRIVLLEFDIHESKKTAEFYKNWHRKIGADELENAIANYTGRLPMWFKTEPFILHVAAENLDSATDFLKKIRGLGIKRGGIQTIDDEKAVMEIRGHGTIVIPLDSARLDYEKMTSISNEMFEKNERIVKKLETTL